MLMLLTCLAVAIAPVDTVPLPSVDDVDALVAYALTVHPDLGAATARRQAAAARVDQVGSLPDPVFRWGEMIESVETRVGPQQRILSLQQPLPWPGTLGARGDAADARESMAAAGERGAAVRVAAGVRRAWAHAAWLGESRRVVQRQLTLVRAAEDAVRSSYEAGRQGYADLLQVQLEVARLEDRLRSLEDESLAARAGLNAALGRDPAAPLPLPEDLAAGAVPVATPADTVPHPQLEVLDHEATAARLDAEAARAGGRPTLSIGVDWIQVGEARVDGVPDSGKDAWVARFGVSLPLWRGKHDGAATAADAQAAALQAERRARDHALGARRAAATVAWRDAERRRQLHREDLLPRARQVYEAVLASYRTGGATFAEVLSAERTLLELEVGLLAARRDAVVAMADLDEAAGVVPVPHEVSERSEP
jgi:outer membrane protein TolC